MPERDAAVLVVGAGPTGLVLALVLARRGVAVRVADRKPGPSVESRAIGVQARTLELYRALGLSDRVVAAGLPIEGVQLRVEGRMRARLSLRGMGRGISPYPYLLSYPQDAHERMLLAALAAAGAARCARGWGSASRADRRRGTSTSRISRRGSRGGRRSPGWAGGASR